jgi:hypothetical protein
MPSKTGYQSNSAAANQLPVVAWSGEFAKSGALMSYGPLVNVLAHHAAIYGDKILKGAKPSGPNLTFESRWGFPPDLRCASLAPCALEYPRERYNHDRSPSGPQRTFSGRAYQSFDVAFLCRVKGLNWLARKISENP